MVDDPVEEEPEEGPEPDEAGDDGEDLRVAVSGVLDNSGASMPAKPAEKRRMRGGGVYEPSRICGTTCRY